MLDPDRNVIDNYLHIGDLTWDQMEEYLTKGYEELRRQRESDQVSVKDKITSVQTPNIKGKLPPNSFGNRLAIELRRMENERVCNVERRKQPEQKSMEIDTEKETTTAEQIENGNLGEENGIQARDNNEGIVNDVDTYEQPVGSQPNEPVNPTTTINDENEISEDESDKVDFDTLMKYL